MLNSKSFSVRAGTELVEVPSRSVVVRDGTRSAAPHQEWKVIYKLK